MGYPNTRISEELHVTFVWCIPNPNIFQERYMPDFFGISDIPNIRYKIIHCLFYGISDASADFYSFSL